MKKKQTFTDLLKNFQLRNIQEIISYTLIFAAAFFAVSVILHNAEWILGDNYSFILSTAQGMPAPFLNGANIGGSRFFPLAGLDFNILILFPGGNTAFAHYLYVSITFLAAYLFFFLFSNKSFSDSGTKALRENAFCLAAICCFMIVSNGGFFTTMMNVIYSERQIFMVFALMLLSFLYGRKSGNSLWFVLAAVSAIYSSYLKETVAPALLCFSLSSLLLFRKDMCKCEKMAHYAIIANFLLFMILWFSFGMGGMTGVEIYHLDEKLPFLKLLKIVLWQRKIYLVILSMSVFRIFSIAFFKNKPVYPYDTLLFTSAIFVCEYIVLGFNSDYYYFPALVFGLPALAYFLVSARDYASTIISAKRKMIFAVFASLMAVFVLISVSSGISDAAAAIRLAQLERITVMPGLRMMARHYSAGGNIYWFQPWDKDEKIFNLTELYINFLLNREMGQHRGQNDSVLTVAEIVPQLGENDIFIYKVFHEGKFDADSITLAALQKQNFEFCQFQTGYLVFAYGKCRLFSTAVK